MVPVNPRISYILIFATLATCVIVAALSALARDWNTVFALCGGILLLAVPLVLLRTRHFRAGNIALILLVLTLLTLVVTYGQGLHDTAIIAYPIILIYVGLTSDRAMLRLCVGLTLAAGVWLAVGPLLGLFTPTPVLPITFDFFSLTTLVILVLVAAVAVELLSSYLRRSLEQARHEIEERKKLEEQRARLSAQLAQAQKMESVGRLAGGVAHDFNNMLGVILGHTEVALEEVGPGDPMRETLEEIRKAAVHSADLTRQLLAFARRQTVAPRVVDLNATVQGMLSMLQRMIGEDIHLAWEPDAALWPVRVDPSQLDQILFNLCVNARDAIRGVGTLSIRTGNRTLTEAFCAEHPGSSPGDFAMLTVRDDGSGMDTETVSHLFEPFFTTKGIGEGTGLGLATVYGAVKQNHGFIEVRSEPGKGTTFTIYLPRYGTASAPQAAAESAGPLRGGRETILVVEDEEGLLKLTRTVLERQGYTVIASAVPSDALRAAREHAGPIHLLVTDVVMPDMNGRDLAGNLRELHPDLKCLFMSGYPSDVITDEGVLKSGVTFLQKPFSARVLTESIRKALEG